MALTVIPAQVAVFYSCCQYRGHVTEHESQESDLYEEDDDFFYLNEEEDLEPLLHPILDDFSISDEHCAVPSNYVPP